MFGISAVTPQRFTVGEAGLVTNHTPLTTTTTTATATTKQTAMIEKKEAERVAGS